MKKNEEEIIEEKENIKQNPLRRKMNLKEVINIIIFALIAVTIYAVTTIESPKIKTEIVNAMVSKAESFGLDDVSVFTTGKEKIEENHYYLVTVDSSNFGNLMPEQMIAIATRLSLEGYYIKNTFTSKGSSYWVDLSSGRIYMDGEEIYSGDETSESKPPASSAN